MKTGKKLRVAFVCNSLYGGGAERVLQTVLGNLDAERYDITLVDLHRETPDELYPAGIRFRSILRGASLPGKVHNRIAMWVCENFPPRVFRALYLRRRFDVEVAFIEGYATRIVAGGRSRRRIAWVHCDAVANPWADIAFRSYGEQRECYRRFERVVCVSASVQRAFEYRFGATGTAVVLHNPVDGAAVRRAANEFTVDRADVGAVTHLVSVGRLSPEKGFDRLIPIVGRLVASGLDARLWIVGEGSERARLEGLIHEWGLASKVTLTGWQPNPMPWVAAADWFVCSSRTEGYSTAVIEALIAGVPVATTLVAGMSELLGDSHWGLVVPNDDDALHDALRRLITDPGPLSALYRSRAAIRARDFSLAASMAAICKIIEP